MVNEVVSIIREFDEDLKTDECLFIAENLLCVYYLNRLWELGLVTQGGYKVTPKGFEKALELLEIGFKVDEEGIWRFVYELTHEDSIEESEKHLVFELIENLQNKGYERVKEEVEKLKRTLAEEEDV